LMRKRKAKEGRKGLWGRRNRSGSKNTDSFQNIWKLEMHGIGKRNHKIPVIVLINEDEAEWKVIHSLHRISVAIGIADDHDGEPK
jgi:hypothetical protein